MASLLDALKSAKFVTDSEGQQVAIQIQPAVWKALVAWLESTNGGPVFEGISQPLIENDSALIEASARLSEPSFATVWDNSEDDVYNEL